MIQLNIIWKCRYINYI